MAHSQSCGRVKDDAEFCIFDISPRSRGMNLALRCCRKLATKTHYPSPNSALPTHRCPNETPCIPLVYTSFSKSVRKILLCILRTCQLVIEVWVDDWWRPLRRGPRAYLGRTEKWEWYYLPSRDHPHSRRGTTCRVPDEGYTQSPDVGLDRVFGALNMS